MHSHNMLYTYYIAQPHDDWMLSIHNYKLFIFPVIEVEEFFIVLHQNMNVSKRKDKKNTE